MAMIVFHYTNILHTAALDLRRPQALHSSWLPKRRHAGVEVTPQLAHLCTTRQYHEASLACHSLLLGQHVHAEWVSVCVLNFEGVGDGGRRVSNMHSQLLLAVARLLTWPALCAESDLLRARPLPALGPLRFTGAALPRGALAGWRSEPCSTTASA